MRGKKWRIDTKQNKIEWNREQILLWEKASQNGKENVGGISCNAEHQKYFLLRKKIRTFIIQIIIKVDR